MRPPQRTAARHPRRGQALVEFAVVAFVFTLLVAGVLTFGFALYGANVLQQAADAGAMELARHPAPPDQDFPQSLSDSGLFVEEDLVVPVGTVAADLPLINRLLFGLYIYDPDIDQLRYPGALVTNTAGEQTVVIPIVGSGNRDPETGVETISEWRRVVEEVIPPGQTSGPYSLTASDEETGMLSPGMVALRINYPFQSGAMVAYQYHDQLGNVIDPREVLGVEHAQNIRVEAEDQSVSGASVATFPDGQSLSSAGYTLVGPTANPDFGASAHRGTYGFGELQAFATQVRPYRKVLTAQAIYRREVFE